MRDGQVVKGVRFRDHRVVGDILALARRYRDDGADELVFYDITASPENRSVERAWVSRVAEVLDIPFCVAGGVSSVAQAETILGAGAEKISVNSPALERPQLIDELARRFGAQCVVVGIDSQATGNSHHARNRRCTDARDGCCLWPGCRCRRPRIARRSAAPVRRSAVAAPAPAS